MRAADAKQSCSLSISSDNLTLMLSSLYLPASTVITLAISNGVTDQSGNALANYTSQFTTAPVFDTTHATVVNKRRREYRVSASPDLAIHHAGKTTCHKCQYFMLRARYRLSKMWHISDCSIF